jgi:hypothetical protein
MGAAYCIDALLSKEFAVMAALLMEFLVAGPYG